MATSLCSMASVRGPAFSQTPSWFSSASGDSTTIAFDFLGRDFLRFLAGDEPPSASVVLRLRDAFGLGAAIVPCFAGARLERAVLRVLGSGDSGAASSSVFPFDDAKGALVLRCLFFGGSGELSKAIATPCASSGSRCSSSWALLGVAGVDGPGDEVPV